MCNSTGGNTGSDVHLELAVICNVFFFLVLFFELLQFAQGVCGGHSDPWDLRQAAGRGPSDGRVSTVQEKLPVIDDSGTSRRGGEERSPGGLAVAVGQLGPVLEGEHSGRDGDALYLVGGCGHGGGGASCGGRSAR